MEFMSNIYAKKYSTREYFGAYIAYTNIVTKYRKKINLKEYVSLIDIIVYFREGFVKSFLICNYVNEHRLT